MRFLGNHYSCEALAETIMEKGLRKVAIRVDEEDIGAVAVEIDGLWHTAPCKAEGYDGVSADTWIAAMADLKRRYDDQAAIAEPIRLAAIAAITERAANAQAKVGSASGASGQAAADARPAACLSRSGGRPKVRPYSRVNCDTLS